MQQPQTNLLNSLPAQTALPGSVAQHNVQGKELVSIVVEHGQMPHMQKHEAGQRRMPHASAMRRGLSKLFMFLSCMVCFGGCVGVVMGCLAGALLLIVSKEDIIGVKPDPLVSLTGFLTAVIFIIGTIILFCCLAFVRSKASKLVEELAMTSKSQEQLQERFAKEVIARLNSARGEKCRKWLLDAGIGEQALESVLTTPPDQMQDALLRLLDANVKARVTCFMFEELMSSIYDQLVVAFVTIFLGVPGMLVLLLLLIADSAVSMVAPSMLSSVISGIGLCTFVFLRIQWFRWFVLSLSCLDAAMFLSLAIQWVSHKATVCSVVASICAGMAYPVFAIICIVHICYIQPGFVALFQLLVEHMRVCVWQTYGLERDPDHLKNRKMEMERASGPLFRFIMNTFLPEFEGLV